MLNNKTNITALIFIAFSFSSVYSQNMNHQMHNHKSNYISEINNEIKALSDEEVSQLKNGEGMGLAKAAELNGYPGPKHVLDLSSELNLTGEQKEKTDSLFQLMKNEAVQLGKKIVTEEKQLDDLFYDGRINEDLLKEKISLIAELKGRLRLVHLKTHLAQKRILTAEQVEAYKKLRGYN